MAGADLRLFRLFLLAAGVAAAALALDRTALSGAVEALMAMLDIPSPRWIDRLQPSLGRAPLAVAAVGILAVALWPARGFQIRRGAALDRARLTEGLARLQGCAVELQITHRPDRALARTLAAAFRSAGWRVDLTAAASGGRSAALLVSCSNAELAGTVGALLVGSGLADVRVLHSLSPAGEDSVVKIVIGA